MEEQLIDIRNLSKKYGSRSILKDVNLSIEKGQSIAFTGHNGSGKSTLLKIICGLTKHDSGSINYSKQIKFNYIPEHFPRLNLSAKKYIELVAGMEELSLKERNQKMEELFQMFYLTDMINTPMKFLSKGTLQKVGVVQALLTQPDILLLDEPLSGQDADSQAAFISHVKLLNKSGVTLIMSCHEPFLINCLSDTIYEIKNGQLTQIEKKSITKKSIDVLNFLNPNNRNSLPEEVLHIAEDFKMEPDTIKLMVDQEQSNLVILKMLEEGYQLRGMYNEIMF